MSSSTQSQSEDTDLEKEIQLLESRLNSVVRSVETSEEEISRLQAQVAELGERVESLQEDLRLAAEHEARLSPLEQAVVFYDDFDNCDLLTRASHIRAARILSRWDNWSASRPTGRAIHTQHENIIARYADAYDEQLQSVQFKRAFDAVENLTNEKILHQTDAKGHSHLYLKPGVTVYTTKEQLAED